jgi:hypothetical protein
MSDAALEKLKTLSTEETFKVKSKAMALNLLDECYDTVVSRDIPAPFAQKIEMLKTVAKFADLEPRQNSSPVGVGFSIRVVYSGADSKAGATITIDNDDTTALLDSPPEYFSLSASPTVALSLLEVRDDESQLPDAVYSQEGQR